MKTIFSKTPKLLCAIALSVTALSSSQSLFADDGHHQNTAFTEQKVSSHITMLQGKGGNIALLSGDDGLLLVDDDYKEMSSALKKQLAKHGGIDAIKYIINTHWHGDHSGGNLLLGKHATIVAHDNVRKRLLTKHEIKLFKMSSPAYPKDALPSITYQRDMRLYINDEQVTLVHFANGHTDGDSVVFFKQANVVHMGDHYFSGFFPFVDIDSGGNVVSMTENIASVLNRIDDDTKVIPGHGPLSSKQDLRNYHEMLQNTRIEVEAMKNNGMSLADIQQQGLNQRWRIWGKGFIDEPTWISFVYNSL
ncbi:glyoxylase-like metal-dependent hydrolase (beta-lactamase superfamily II) [Sinobacterium caligoides]|uniref:Glyoxylase-like metal-dependent hydrolase (Beta-lactamase superfamily II) n=1 Tax=Sinobacterium caligoides TaxID=933926 RepID=A0A3N2DN96_9GAMM|nr:MBL fold metallo-hydrolase [Sinobacterium caligoides]ROS01129.1 glyoxylase-like metal-dependent hydrolase (beta-lactamase superfamily II) [Sinobacterium caligoides]